MKITARAAGESRLKQAITGPALFLFILGDVLGAGVYALVGKIAGEAGGAVWVPLLVALGFAMLTAASYAELVSKYPKAGGAAVFVERAFAKPLLSFLVGFCMLAAGVTSAAGLSLAFAGDYLGAFVDTPAVPTALAFLAIVALLNARGIKESLGANAVMTVIEVSGLLFVVVLAGRFLLGGQGEPSRVVEFTPGVSPAIAVLGAALIAFYSFVGFEVSANVAEEVKDVRRNYPRALFGALLAAGLVYMGVGMAATAVLSPATLADSSAPLLDVVRATGYAVPDWLFAAVALVAVANGALLTMIMSSRLAYGMADEGLLPAPLTRVLPKRRTPWLAIMGTTLLAMLLTVTGTLTALAETVVLLLLFVFMSTNVAVLVLRKDKIAEPHFRTPTVLPLLAILSCVLLLSQQSAGTWLRAGLLMALGASLYGIGHWQKRRRR
ncbi:APC family permease [Pseudomonas sp. KSR10]|uniref:APC family permease n=1 Tax=Pseudomonas sp. KSR10 TaxID=2916654 RepID=UPI001EF7799C|nr:APC family permease [Pseudomonas sp. KSR10]MCG6542399.1 APC family permease [Pseudomonas sp. KSR10]